MFGYIIYGDGAERRTVEHRQIAGGAFVVCRVRESRRPNSFIARRRAVQMADKLRASGVRQAVFPLDFPYTAIFIQRGILPVDPLPLRQALAAPLVRRQLERMGLDGTRAVIAISGDRMSRPLMETTKALALRYRYVLLSVPGGEEEFVRSLRREYGISLLLRPSAEQMERADALILFAPRGDMTVSSAVFHALYPGGEYLGRQAPLALPTALAKRLESNCSHEQMVAALYAMGVLSLEDILAEIPVDRTEKYLYNAMNNDIK